MFFSAILKPLGILSGTQLLFTPGNVLNLNDDIFKNVCFYRFIGLFYFYVYWKSYIIKIKGVRNLIIFAKKLTGHTEKNHWIFFPNVARFFAMPVCL